MKLSNKKFGARYKNMISSDFYNRISGSFGRQYKFRGTDKETTSISRSSLQKHHQDRIRKLCQSTQR